MANTFYIILFGHVLDFDNTTKDKLRHYQSIDLANNIKYSLSQYQSTKVRAIFDRYDETPTNDYERIRHAGEEAVDYDITTSSKLPCRVAIMNSKASKKTVVSVLSNFNMGKNVTIV